ncbi:sugar phosphate isomerase/epimerase family protein [Cellulomonas marina]|uniref:Sugar phosphate isomerase/epimerase n=1 Tax=Cellulomonas marina TaxID=988821 RepID=A0A1I0VBL9_9CELL|nr:sugar phosphate isomerase/epimerase family protein [Cellulomonas marina]GIG29159.1 xylose isomerase [Cellulomonas marina]SFA73731.1 Sugar phosphate isomerase/epimerase [Cellulomonas marina]
MSRPQPPYSSATWPVAAAMLPFPPSQDASADTWHDQLAEVAAEGFTEVDLTDGWVRAGDLEPGRLAELADVLRSTGLHPEALSAIRRSVIDPEAGEDNLAYSHRTIDAAAELGCSVVSVGLHRPLTEAQRRVLWFWTVDGPRDDDSAETWALAVRRLRELGEHAADAGLALSLEMYEDTLLGSADSAVRLLEDIGHPSVGLNPDLGNLFRLHRDVEVFQEAVARTLPVANYWHVKSYHRDTDPRTGAVVAVPAPMYAGSLDYRSAVRHAVQVGYTGPFCVEHYGGDGLSVAAENRTYLRKLLAVATGEVARAARAGASTAAATAAGASR